MVFLFWLVSSLSICFPPFLWIDSPPFSLLSRVFIWLGSLGCPVGPIWKGLRLNQNFYTMSNESVVVGPVVAVGDSFSRIIWSLRRRCLCASQALRTITPHSKLISPVIPRM